MDTQDIKRQINLDRIKEHILTTSTVSWDRRITKASLDKWLSNFSGEALGDQATEQTIAAWLLYNFTYYTINEVKELCRVIYRSFIHKRLGDSHFVKGKQSIIDKISGILEHTVFIPMGNPSESGSSILYYFRTANSLPKERFRYIVDPKNKEECKSIDDIVLVDDVTISGSQAKQYITMYSSAECRVTLLTFFATTSAKRLLEKYYPDVSIIYANLIDERNRLFGDDSFVFCSIESKEAQSLREMSYKLCKYYGEKIVSSELPSYESYMKEYPLGYKDGQQMFGFFYNTPNNTLPIFWCNSKRWYPVFERYTKVYDMKGVDIQYDEYW